MKTTALLCGGFLLFAWLHTLIENMLSCRALKICKENSILTQSIKLLVGLANPGPEYVRTRHNAGAWVVEELARVHNVNLKEESKFFGLTGRILVHGQDITPSYPDNIYELVRKISRGTRKILSDKNRRDHGRA